MYSKKKRWLPGRWSHCSITEHHENLIKKTLIFLLIFYRYYYYYYYHHHHCLISSIFLVFGLGFARKFRANEQEFLQIDTGRKHREPRRKGGQID